MRAGFLLRRLTRGFAAPLLAFGAVLLVACGAAAIDAPDYTVVAKREAVEAGSSRLYLTQVVGGVEREIEVRAPCYELAEIGVVIPDTAETTYRDVTVAWACRWRVVRRDALQ